MHVPWVLVATAVLVATLVFGRIHNEDSTANQKETDTEDVMGTNVVATISPASEETPTKTQQAVETPEQTLTTDSPGGDRNYIFPNSEIVEISDSKYVLVSTSSADEITDWYTEKLNSLGLNINTRVRTKANDKVLNKLVAASSSVKVTIEISRENSNSNIGIVVTIE
jgi:hypothetical protein